MKRESLRSEFVEYIPEELDEGVLYVSLKYSIAIHLCCCGCGQQTVTPLGRDQWMFLSEGDKPTLRPSIGNFRMPCKSHYLVEHGAIVWI